jgi:hypothetical protein
MGTIGNVRENNHQVFSPAVLSTFKERPWPRVDAHLILLSMKCFKK